VQNAANALLDSIYYPADDAANDIGDASDHRTAIDVYPVDDLVEAVLHRVGAGVHDILGRVGHRLDNGLDRVANDGHAAEYGVAEILQPPHDGLPAASIGEVCFRGLGYLQLDFAVSDIDRYTHPRRSSYPACIIGLNRMGIDSHAVRASKQALHLV
jgi:hypothetical protein